jgi:hypothetical protein
VDLTISRADRLLTRFAIRYFENPILSLVWFFIAFYPLLLVTLIVKGNLTAVVFDLIVSLFVVLLLWVFLYPAAISSKGVIVSAERIKVSRIPKEAVKTHFEIILRFLRFELNELEVDVLAVRSRHGLGSGARESRKYTARIAVQALTLWLTEQLIYLPIAERDTVLDLYVADLRSTFERMPTAEGATVDFVARHFDGLDDRLRNHAKGWRPSPSFLETIEKHSAAVAVFLTLTIIAIAVIGAAIFKVSIPISP